jgi:hypothetical protein
MSAHPTMIVKCQFENEGCQLIRLKQPEILVENSMESVLPSR